MGETVGHCFQLGIASGGDMAVEEADVGAVVMNGCHTIPVNEASGRRENVKADILVIPSVGEEYRCAGSLHQAGPVGDGSAPRGRLNTGAVAENRRRVRPSAAQPGVYGKKIHSIDSGG